MPSNPGDPGSEPVLSLARIREEGLLHLVEGVDKDGRVKIVESLRALDMLARMQGMYRDGGPQVAVQVNVQQYREMPMEELERIVQRREIG